MKERIKDNHLLAFMENRNFRRKSVDFQKKKKQLLVPCFPIWLLETVWFPLKNKSKPQNCYTTLTAYVNTENKPNSASFMCKKIPSVLNIFRILSIGHKAQKIFQSEIFTIHHQPTHLSLAVISPRRLLL